MKKDLQYINWGLGVGENLDQDFGQLLVITGKPVLMFIHFLILFFFEDIHFLNLC